MSMPKAPMYKNHLVPGRKHKVRGTRKITPMKTIPVASAMRDAPYDQLWLGILPTNQRHARATLR